MTEPTVAEMPPRPRREPDRASSQGRPPRTWRLWAVAALGFLCLCCLIPTVIIPTYRVGETARRFSSNSPLMPRTYFEKQLGGPGRAVLAIRLYLLLPDSWVRYKPEAVYLAMMYGRPAIPLLIDRLKGNYPMLQRGAAAAALGEIGPAAAEAVPLLLEQLTDNDKWVRTAAADALGQISPTSAQSAVPVLVDALNDPSTGDPWGYCRTLGLIGPPAREAVPTLEKLLTSQDAFLRQAAAEALVKIRGEKAP